MQDLLDQDILLPEFSNLGVVGNEEHLKKHGDHTPWSAGKLRGVIYAKDTHCPDGFRAWFIAKCKSSYNTMWVDFWNCDGRQYDKGGNDVGPSADYHFHVSVEKGSEDVHVNLFNDFIRETRAAQMTTVDPIKWDADIAKLVNNYVTAGQSTPFNRAFQLGFRFQYEGFQYAAEAAKSLRALSTTLAAAATAEAARDELQNVLIRSLIEAVNGLKVAIDGKPGDPPVIDGELILHELRSAKQEIANTVEERVDRDLRERAEAQKIFADALHAQVAAEMPA